MTDFSFDGANKLIVEPAGAGDTQYDVKDIYSAWKRWLLDGNHNFEAAFVVEGGTPIGSTGLFTGTTFILSNGWRIRGASHGHQLFLVGNLYSDDGIVASEVPGHSVTVFVSSAVAAQGIATGSALTAAQDTKLDELWMMRGLRIGSPLVVTPDGESAGGVELTIEGDGETGLTLTRSAPE